MLTPEQINFLNRVCPNRWTEHNEVILVKGNVDISHMNLTEIPVQFGRVTGHFDCGGNKLTNLKGAPVNVNGAFICSANKLSTLDGGPKHVGEYYSCARNQLTTLIGSPETCNSFFGCSHNQLTSLEGCPKLIKDNLFCHNNPNLKYIWGIGQVCNAIEYDNFNEINIWIIELARKDIIFPFTLNVINKIKQEHHYSRLSRAPREIRERFSSHILYLIDFKIC